MKVIGKKINYGINCLLPCLSIGLDRPNCFGWVKVILVWDMGLNHLDGIQIILFRRHKYRY